MKRFLAVLVLVLSLALTGCSETEPENELENALELMEEADSFRMDLTMGGIPLFGTVTVVTKADGDMRFQGTFLGDTYSKIIDGLEYEYVLDENNELVLSETANDAEDSADDYDFLLGVEAEDFTKDGSVWTYSGETLYLDDDQTETMSDIIITLDSDGYLDLMTFTLNTDSLTSDVELDISGVNSTVITLP